MSEANEEQPVTDTRCEAGSKSRRIWNFFRILAGLRPKISLRTDLQDVLADERAGDPGFSPQERSMLKNILDLREVRVADVMVPRADIVAVEHATPIGELLNIFRDAGHSRLPVYRETLDDPVGMVHIRDFVAYLTTGAPRMPGGHKQKQANAIHDFDKIDLDSPLSVANIIRPVLFAPPSMPAMDLLVKMQATRVHMALVIDEYGGTDGLVSIENLIEEVVGEIDDEHDEDEKSISATGDAWVASARASIDEIREAIGEDFDIGQMGDEVSERAEEVDTVGGLVTAMVGRVPVRGELIKSPNGFEFEVLDADPRHVKRLRIRRLTSEARARRPPSSPSQPDAPVSSAR